MSVPDREADENVVFTGEMLSTKSTVPVLYEQRGLMVRRGDASVAIPRRSTPALVYYQ